MCVYVWVWVWVCVRARDDGGGENSPHRLSVTVLVPLFRLSLSVYGDVYRLVSPRYFRRPLTRATSTSIPHPAGSAPPPLCTSCSAPPTPHHCSSCLSPSRVTPAPYLGSTSPPRRAASRITTHPHLRSHAPSPRRPRVSSESECECERECESECESECECERDHMSVSARGRRTRPRTTTNAAGGSVCV